MKPLSRHYSVAREGPRQLVLDVQAVTPTGEALAETITLHPLDETVMLAMGQLEMTLADFLWPVPDSAVPLAHRFVRDLTQSGGVEGLEIWDSELLAAMDYLLLQS